MVVKHEDHAKYLVIGTEDTLLSDVWRFWRGVPQNSFYAGARQTSGQLKVSLHPVGERPWRIAFTTEYTKSDGFVKGSNRVLHSWAPPPSDGTDFALAFQIFNFASELQEQERRNEPENTLIYPPPLAGEVVEYRLYLSRSSSTTEDVLGLRAATSIPDVFGIMTAWLVVVTRRENENERKLLEQLRSRFHLDGPVPEKVEVSAVGVWVSASGVPILTFASLKPGDACAVEGAIAIHVTPGA